MRTSGVTIIAVADELGLHETVLRRWIQRYGKPGTIVSDNGPEPTSRAMLERQGEAEVARHTVAPGKPTENASTENAFIESFNGRLRDERLNEEAFDGLAHARPRPGAPAARPQPRAAALVAGRADACPDAAGVRDPRRPGPHRARAGLDDGLPSVGLPDDRGRRGAQVKANHGTRDWFEVSGRPVGREMREDLLHEREQGSIIVVIATDCPLSPLQLDRLARRAGLGIGRNGTKGGNGSGDIFLAFTTANPFPVPGEGPAMLELRVLNDAHIDPLFEAAVQAVEEAVVNAMVAAEDRVAVKPAGRLVRAIDTDRLRALIG